MKNLVLSSFLLIFFNSCGTYSQNFQVSEKKVETYTPEFLLTSPSEKIFRMSIDAYGTNYSGNVVSKRINSNHYRFAFLNEFGGKMLDFELENQEMKIHYVMEQLDRKIILNLLKKDFNLLFDENNSVKQTFKFEDYLIFQSEINSKSVYYYLKNDTLQKTVMTGKKSKKIDLQYSYETKEFPDVEISHEKIKIKIYLHLLDSN